MIESSTTALREVDPLAKNCVATSDDYEVAILNYGRAITDPELLMLNLLYHTENMYDSYLDIEANLDTGF